MEVTAVNGNTITFATPFHATFKTAYAAQLTRYTAPFLHEVGIEDLALYGGMGGDGHGNLAMGFCEYCWVKNVEAYWSVGTNIGLYSTYRSVVRDSYMHETPDPNPGGGGYQFGINSGAADNLVENNIMWNGNKEIVMRASGGGNVVAYNYMDDSFGSSYPESPEAGLNAGHYTTPHMELLEGNQSQNYKGDSFWGNSIDITVFRNWLTALRGANPPLNTYSSAQGSCNFHYGDYDGRTAVDVQAHSYRTNFVGNVLGMQGQVLLSDPHPDSNTCYDSVQHAFAIEGFDTFTPNNQVVMWNIGALQTPTNWSWVATTYQTQLREGNWDWVTQSQKWYGIGGTQANPLGTPQAIPDSLYLSSKPAFFGSNQWPWVDPTTGTTYTLPAKVRSYSSEVAARHSTAKHSDQSRGDGCLVSSQINLSWTVSTDYTTVAGYKIFGNGTNRARFHRSRSSRPRSERG